MSEYAVVTLSCNGVALAQKILDSFEADFFVHTQVPNGALAFAGNWVIRFSRVLELTEDIFSQYRGIVYIMPGGVVARAIAPLLCHKKRDPAIVVLDVLGRWAVSYVSGHEGGANALALKIANITGAEPVITTTTEAEKNIICGVGCRRGIARQTVLDAIYQAVESVGVTVEEIRLLATVRLKEKEPGLLEAAQALKLPVRIVPDVEILQCCRGFEKSEFVQEQTGLPAVAEPCALLAGRRTEFLLRRITHEGVTVALARECCG